MLFQVSHVTGIFHLTIKLLPPLRLIGSLKRVTVTVDFVFVHRNLFVVYKVFSANNTAIKTAVPLQYNVVVANVKSRYVFGMIRRSFGLQSDRGTYAS